MTKQIPFIVLLLSISILFSSCKKESDVQLDKQVSLQFGGYSKGNLFEFSDTSWYYLREPDYRLVNFNKDNYSDLQSIVFSAAIFSYDVLNYCMVELYNLTDSISIENSLIKNNKSNLYESFDYIESPDIMSFLPNKTIDLCVRIKSSKSGKTSGLYPKMYLTLNR